MQILDRYIIKTVFISTLLFLLVIVALYGFIALSDSFKFIGRNTFSISDADFRKERNCSKWSYQARVIQNY